MDRSRTPARGLTARSDVVPLLILGGGGACDGTSDFMTLNVGYSDIKVNPFLKRGDRTSTCGPAARPRRGPQRGQAFVDPRWRCRFRQLGLLTDAVLRSTPGSTRSSPRSAPPPDPHLPMSGVEHLGAEALVALALGLGLHDAHRPHLGGRVDVGAAVSLLVAPTMSTMRTSRPTPGSGAPWSGSGRDRRPPHPAGGSDLDGPVGGDLGGHQLLDLGLAARAEDQASTATASTRKQASRRAAALRCGRSRRRRSPVAGGTTRL
jgi:hypothetical protein